jgi:phosphoglycerol transferase MdoB-like AlkP superfamily enzyme
VGNKIKQYFKINFVEGFFLSLYLIYIVFFHNYRNIQTIVLDTTTVFIIGRGLLSILLLLRITETLFKNHLKIYRSCIILFYSVYEILCLYHYRMRSNLTFPLIFENSEELMNKEALLLVWDSIFVMGKFKDFVTFCIFLGILLFFGIYKKKLTPRELPRPKVQLVISALLYLLIVNSNVFLYEELTYFVQTAYHHNNSIRVGDKFEQSLKTSPYPYLKKKSRTSGGGERPHIFVVALESLNGNFVNSKSPEGKEYTPFLNSLIHQGLFVPNYFAHSVQTVKGHFSLLCGLVPLYKKKAFKVDVNLNCLPNILKGHGYYNYFIQGYGVPNFDNTRGFSLKNGFDHFEITDTSKMSEEQRKKHIWGFGGVQDNYTYKQTFDTLDRLYKENPDKVFFTMVASISNHLTFRYVPEDQRYLYKNPRDKLQYFANSIRVADEYLKTFFEELNKREHFKDSIVVVTGDQSFPAGEHGYYFNEAGFYNELFKTSMLIIWRGRITPSINPSYFAQVDFPGSLLELLKISEDNHFQGESLFKRKREGPIFLVQPYDGIYLGLIDYPYKYIFHNRTKREYLFDLEKDTHESTNLSGLDKMETRVKQYSQLIQRIYQNEYLIMNNKIWP